MLGLAFHPQYAVNGRFFVYYVRPGDGSLVIAEYGVSVNANHSGGMLAFGPDGYLYMGTGDGGSGNDPPNNAQNSNVLPDTSSNISSFGEDERGELYVVALGGSLSRISSTCAYGIAPTSQNVSAPGGTGSVTVTATAGCAWTAAANASWLHVTSGSTGSGSVTVDYIVDASAASARWGPG